MPDRADIRTSVKQRLNRSPDDIDATLNEYINQAVQLFGHTLSSLYDEQRWEYVINSTDVTNEVDILNLPFGLKYILNLDYIDVSGSEDVYYPMKVVSPKDITSRVFNHGAFGNTNESGIDYGVQTFTYGGNYQHGRRAGRVNHTAPPEMATRIANTLHIFPRPGIAELGDKIRLLGAFYPVALVTDTDTNTITANYPQALIAYVCGLYSLLTNRDSINGQMWMQQASLLLQSYRKQDEVSKLININVSFSRGD